MLLIWKLSFLCSKNVHKVLSRDCFNIITDYILVQKVRHSCLFSLHTMAAFRPTSIGNLAFAHKGFTFNSFSIVFSVMTFQGIVFLESLLKRWFPQVQLWQIKQWKACNLSKTAVIKTETFCRRVRLGLIIKWIPNFCSPIVWTPGGYYVYKDLRSLKNVNKTAKSLYSLKKLTFSISIFFSSYLKLNFSSILDKLQLQTFPSVMKM